MLTAYVLRVRLHVRRTVPASCTRTSIRRETSPSPDFGRLRKPLVCERAVPSGVWQRGGVEGLATSGEGISAPSKERRSTERPVLRIGNAVGFYPAAKPLIPIHECARSCRFFLYVRVTVYSLPPLTRITYSPVAQGRISSTKAAFTNADR